MRWFESSRPCHTLKLFKSSPFEQLLFIGPTLRQVLRVSKMMVFTGNASPDLARRVVRQLHIPSVMPTSESFPTVKSVSRSARTFAARTSF